MAKRLTNQEIEEILRPLENHQKELEEIIRCINKKITIISLTMIYDDLKNMEYNNWKDNKRGIMKNICDIMVKINQM